MHPGYNPLSRNNDICLLELDGDLTFGPSVAPVAMPIQDEEFADGSDGIISGWGLLHSTDFVFPKALQWTTVPLVSQEREPNIKTRQ